MDKRVVITGMGIISPIGNDLGTFWNSLENGICGIDFIKSVSTEGLNVKVAGEVKDFKATDFGIDAKAARKYDRFCLFAMAAANQAVAQSGLKVTDDRDCDDP